MKKIGCIFVILIFIILILFRGIICDKIGPFAEEHNKYQTSLQIGMKKEEVISRLGQPRAFFGPGTKPEIYCQEGYVCSKHEVSGSVYIFTGYEAIAYVFFNKDDKVEYFYIGGS